MSAATPETALLPAGTDSPAALGRFTADLVLDADGLSALVGRPVRATRLRHKPGLSTLAALTENGTPVGWVHAVTAEHRVKVDKSIARAQDRGHTVHTRTAGPGIAVAWGCLDTDARLHRALRELAVPSLCAALAAGELRLLRYNPHRRMVVHRPGPGGGSVLRLTVDRQRRPGDLPAALQQAGVPALAPAPHTGQRTGGRVSVWPWFGVTTLAGAAPEAAARMGQVLGRLHRLEALPGAARVPADAGRPARVAGDLARLDPALGAAARTLVARLAELLAGRLWRQGAVHGDFSADQVLLDAEDGLRVIDFDRVGTGPRLLDVGEFAAVELLDDLGEDDPPHPARTRALLAGYPDPVDPDDLRVWTARALLNRLDEPFRAGHPDWAEQVWLRLDQVGRVLP